MAQIARLGCVCRTLGRTKFAPRLKVVVEMDGGLLAPAIRLGLDRLHKHRMQGALDVIVLVGRSVAAAGCSGVLLLGKLDACLDTLRRNLSIDLGGVDVESCSLGVDGAVKDRVRKETLQHHQNGLRADTRHPLGPTVLQQVETGRTCTAFTCSIIQ